MNYELLVVNAAFKSTSGNLPQEFSYEGNSSKHAHDVESLKRVTEMNGIRVLQSLSAVHLQTAQQGPGLEPATGAGHPENERLPRERRERAES